MRSLPTLLLSAALLTKLSSCGSEKRLEKPLPSPSAVHQVAHSQEAKPPHLLETLTAENQVFFEKLIAQYQHDPERLRGVAQQYEKDWNWKLSLVLYKSIGDETAATQLLHQKFRAGWLTETEMDHYGFKPSIDDLTERAISESGCGDWGAYFEYAAQACEKSSNKEALRRLALKLEDNAQKDPGCYGNLAHAIKCYRKIGDGDAVSRIAEIASRQFIESWTGDESNFRTEYGLIVSKDLWNRRGNYWLERGELFSARFSYQKAGNRPKIEQLLHRAEQEHDYTVARNAALALGNRKLAQDMAKRDLMQTPYHPMAVEHTLELVGLENDIDLYRQVAHAQAQLGRFAYAVQLYEKIGDQQGIRDALALATSAKK